MDRDPRRVIEGAVFELGPLSPVNIFWCQALDKRVKGRALQIIGAEKKALLPDEVLVVGRSELNHTWAPFCSPTIKVLVLDARGTPSGTCAQMTLGPHNIAKCKCQTDIATWENASHKIAALDKRFESAGFNVYFPPTERKHGRYLDILVQPRCFGRFGFEYQTSHTFQTEVSPYRCGSRAARERYCCRHARTHSQRCIGGN